MFLFYSTDPVAALFSTQAKAMYEQTSESLSTFPLFRATIAQVVFKA